MKYIVTDSIKSVNRIIRRKNNAGKPTFGIESITSLGLAWQTIMDKKSEGGLVSLKLINNNTASAIVLELILKNPGLLPFVPKESIALATAREILDNMNLLRENNPAESTEDRVKYLTEFIKVYEDTLKRRNLLDEPMVLHEAIEILKADKTKIPPEEIEVCYFNKPSELEEEFVSLLKKTGEFEKPESNNSSFTFVKAYGVPNEADYVAKTIIEKNIPLGETEIICDTSVYAPYIKEAFTKRGLAYNFTSSINGAGFNLIQILINLIDWDLNGCRYEDLFKVMFNPLFAFESDGKLSRASSAFLKGIDYGIGWGKDRYFDVEQSGYEISHGYTESEYQKTFRENELPLLGKLSEKLESAVKAVDALDALLDYCNEHKFKRNAENRYTTKSLLNLRKSLASVGIEFSDKTDRLEYLKNELNSISFSQGEKSNATNVSSIYTPACIEREHVFILGLSAKEFKISVAESPVLGDDLRKALFGNSVRGNVTLAENAIDKAEEVVRGFIKYLPDESDITITSSSADTMRDSSDVSTSALFEKLLSESGKAERDILNVTGYQDITTFDASVPRSTAWNGYDSNWPEKQSEYTLSFSKSSLDTFLACPLCYHYDKDLHINKEEYSDYNPDQWLNPAETGTFVHRILEQYANSKLKDQTSVDEIFDPSCKEFLDVVSIATQEIESAKAAPNDSIRDAEIKGCVDMATAYLTHLHKDLHDNHWVVISCEEAISREECSFSFSHNDVDFDIQFDGVVDRIDRKENEDGSFSYRIGDYKTGKYKSATDMAKKTKQHLIYASYVEKKYGGKVECFDYLYLKTLRDGETDWIASLNSDKLSDEILSAVPGENGGLSEQEVIYQAFAEHDFCHLEYDDKSDTHKYCKYKDICLHNLI